MNQSLSIFELYKQYLNKMQAYCKINSLLRKSDLTFTEFEKEMTILSISTETYLNLFLTTVVCERYNDPNFNKYVDLLLNFKSITGKKSADINYVGYKDRKSILMHACQTCNKQNIEYLLTISNINLQITDPSRKTALFYAIRNKSESNSNSIINLLLDIDCDLIKMQANNNKSVLFEALEMKRFTTLQLLLKRGADVNMQLDDTENSISHEVIKTYQQNKQFTIKLLHLFLKNKANFNITNREGKTVFEAALSVGLELSEFSEMFKDSIEDDKQSLTTLNQQTKKGDNASQVQQIWSNICSQRVDFSQADFQQELQDIEQQQSLISIEDNQQLQISKPSINFIQLQKEIQQFSVRCQEKHRQNWINIHPFLSSLEKLANNNNLVIQVIGSFATGLWTQNSNINLNLIPMQKEYINFENILQRIFKALRNKKSLYGINNIYMNFNKINTIKVQLGQKYNYLTIDIAIFHHNNQNRLYVNYILQATSLYPQIKPLFFVFKKICQTYNLHEHLFGGLKTYTLFLMIYSIVKNLSSQNLGELFNQIALYYGFYYQYEFQYKQERMIQMKPSSQQEIISQPKMVFNFVDPLNPINNVGGKGTKVQEVQTMFKSLYFLLNQIDTAPYLLQVFELHSIF